MKEFILSGPGWFDGLPEPVIWISGGAVAYYNAAARALAQRAGWRLEEGSALPEALEGLEEGALTALNLGGGAWLCRSTGVDGGTLLQFTREPGDRALSLDRLSQLAGRMRPPLGNLIGAIQLLEYPRENRTPEKEEQYRAIERKNYHILLRMLDNLELLGELSEEGERFHPAVLDFGGLCAEVVRSAGGLCEQAGQTLRLECGAGNLLVLGEEQRLRMMLYQLLSNALRAAGASGAVLLRLEKRGRMVRLTVSDSGAGLAPWELADAFDPGSAPERLTQPESGLGLGISICRAVAERHGGRIAMLSGDGGRTVVELPLCDSVEGGALHIRQDYHGGLNETLVQLSDVLPWQCFVREID